MAQVAAVLSDVDPQDRDAVTLFFRKQFPTYSAPTQEMISGFLISLTTLASDEDLGKLKRAVSVAERRIDGQAHRQSRPHLQHTNAPTWASASMRRERSPATAVAAGKMEATQPKAKAPARSAAAKAMVKPAAKAATKAVAKPAKATAGKPMAKPAAKAEKRLAATRHKISA
jgi:hypothetical protein